MVLHSVKNAVIIIIKNNTNMGNPKEKTYVEEVIVIIRPTTSNQIFNEERYTKLTDQYDSEGIRTIFLREKVNLTDKNK